MNLQLQSVHLQTYNSAKYSSGCCLVVGAPLGSLMIAFRQVHPPHGEQAPNTHSRESMVHRESQYPQHGEHGARIKQRANTHSTVHPQLGATEGKQCASTARRAPMVGSQLLKVHNITAQLTSSPGAVRAWAAPRPIAVRPDRAAKRLKSQTNQLQPTAFVVGW